MRLPAICGPIEKSAFWFIFAPSFCCKFCRLVLGRFCSTSVSSDNLRCSDDVSGLDENTCDCVGSLDFGLKNPINVFWSDVHTAEGVNGVDLERFAVVDGRDWKRLRETVPEDRLLSATGTEDFAAELLDLKAV